MKENDRLDGIVSERKAGSLEKLTWGHWARMLDRDKRNQYVPAVAAAPSADSRIVSVDDIYTYCDGLGIPLLITDDEYCLMTLESFAEQVAVQLSNMQKLGVAVYETNSRDCEDFAFLARELIRVSHTRTQGHPKAGLAVGVYIYQPDGAESLHAINCAFVREGEGLDLVWSEPQGGYIVKLSKAEQLNCMGIWL